MIVSAIVGYLTIRYFLKFLAGHSLDGFAYYRIGLAVVTIVWLFTRQA
jgi:undecaprenyl-diphosphatase